MEVYQLKCQVCGDNAKGYNFKGLSCGSCKAFFIRNTAKHDANRLSCIFHRKSSKLHNTCVINRMTRKNCKLCRMNKCIEIGMQKSLVNHTKCKIGTQLTSEERESIRHLDYAMKASFVDERLMNDSADDTGPVIKDLVDALNCPVAYIKATIQFCKYQPTFNVLSSNDQLAVLKPFFTEMLVLRYAFGYCAKRDGFPVAQLKNQRKSIFMRLDVFDRYTHQHITPLIRHIIVCLNNLMDNDTIIQHLIIAQLLFKSRSNFSCTQYNKSNYYGNILRKYLQTKYPSKNEGLNRLNSIVNQIGQIETLRKTLTEVYRSIDIEKLDPVLVEIYNVVE